MHVTASYEESAHGSTMYSITWQPHESDAQAIATFDSAREGMNMGFAGTFSKLDAYLRKLQG